MKRTLACFGILILGTFCTLIHAKEKQTKLELFASPWLFQSGSAPTSALTTLSPEGKLSIPEDTTFTIQFTIDIPSFENEKEIVCIPEILNVKLRQANPQDRAEQNYPAFKMADGTVPVLEAALALQLPVEDNAVRNMIVGIPLGRLSQPLCKHEIILHFSGIHWTMYVDGELLDNDFPLGYPQWEKVTNWRINPELVEKATIHFPGCEPVKTELATPRTSPEIQYWTPSGHNTWVGDVATLYHQGRYHLFYLYDRRGHKSKFGRGAHYFEHISTTDFKTWTEHPAATPLEAQWETQGTGTPFIFNNQLCVSYGLHTTRIYPKEETTLPVQWEFFEKNGRTGTFHIGSTPGYPAGSTYSISQDGITNFKKTGILYHPCENPSIYIDPDGKLRMLANYGARGTWESEDVDGGWYSINPDFPVGGDCTFFFRWGNYDYIIGGFTRFWSKKANETDYQDVVQQGVDPYNGMCVPAITEISDGRFLMAGWVTLVNWGGTLNIHELIQYPDGRIGTKWMEEIIPATETPRLLKKEVKKTTTFDTGCESFLLTFDVYPGKTNKGNLSLLFSDKENPETTCELKLDLNKLRAQYSNITLVEEKTLREGGQPQSGRNYALENLMGTDKPFQVRLIVKGSEKFNGSQIDTEIAGQRTMISYRPELYVKDLQFNIEGVKIQNIQLAPLTN